MASAETGCRVSKCKLDHERHFCQLCKEENTDHISSECPNSKTLYHGTTIRVLKPISIEGLRGSKSGRLGQGVYFVETYGEANCVSKYRREKGDRNSTVVFKCQVNLGHHINLGKGDGDGWQLHHDSARSIHPSWANISHDFKEYCLKDASNCVVTSIYINGKTIKKDENMTWGDAERVIGDGAPISNHKDIKNLLNQLTEENLLNRKIRKFITQLKTEMDGGFRIPDISFKWFLYRWYLVVKTLLTLFFIGNCIWSAIHLNKQDNRNVAAVVSFIVFICFQFIANIFLLIIHGIDSVDKPHEINKIITLSKLLIALFFEMPTVVSQALVLKSIKQNELIWDDFIWDIVIQPQLIFNLALFEAIDLIYHGWNRYKLRRDKLKLWIPGAILLSILISGFVFTPVHLARLGWRWRPELDDFGGTIVSESTRYLLSFSMFFGALSLWEWPVVFPICCLLAMKLMYNFSLRSLYKRWYLLMKAFLILFNILNGIWSLDHLHSKTNDKIKNALRSFAVFYTLQSLANLIYITFHAIYASKDHRMTEKWKKMMIIKIVIAFALEMPMLTSQAYAMRNIDNLVWSDLNWDVAMQLEFIINTISFLAIDLFYMVLERNLRIWKSILSFLFSPLLCGILFAPVYLALAGFNWSINLNNLGGVIGPNDYGIVGLLYVSMGIGLAGFWFWTIVITIISLILILLCANCLDEDGNPIAWIIAIGVFLFEVFL